MVLNNKYTPLHSAALNGNIDIVRLLLEGGANTEAQDKVSDGEGA